MIVIDGTKISFSNMGYFVGDKNWIHPDRVIDTYEIIFVTGGWVFIREGETDYALKKGDVLLLSPNTRHYGYRKSDDASFFWLHFYAENFEKINPRFFHVNDHYNYTLLFRRLNHLSTIGAAPSIIECEIALMLLNRHEKAQSSKLFSEIADYIQVRVASAPTVSGVAEKFGYNPDYLSKLFIKHTGLPLKKYIDSERNGFVKSLLINTNLSIKEIAEAAAFLDHGALIKFFRYNNGLTPTEFRAQNFATHTNNQ